MSLTRLIILFYTLTMFYSDIVKVFEKAGRNMSQKLQKSYPFSKDKGKSNDLCACCRVKETV